jgi:hypothetical protein
MPLVTQNGSVPLLIRQITTSPHNYKPSGATTRKIVLNTFEISRNQSIQLLTWLLSVIHNLSNVS